MKFPFKEVITELCQLAHINRILFIFVYKQSKFIRKKKKRRQNLSIWEVYKKEKKN